MRGPAAALALLLAGALPAAAEAGRYAIGRITVRNGSLIRGVGDVILQRSFDPGCGLPPAVVGPLSTALGASTALQVEVISCPAGLPAPEVSCRLTVGRTVTSFRFQALTQVLPLVLPDLTGIVPVKLDCSFDGGEEEPLATRLYVTYRRPTGSVTVVRPPPESWYRTACEWAAGLGATSQESDVPLRILSEMYRYGQHHWRYGYCRKQGTTCVFDSTTLPTSELSCFEDICKCPWQALIERGDRCNFANCFTFTEVLTYMSAMMGVGGLAEITPMGSRNLGFATQPWLRSFDSAFPGNLKCGSRDLPCSYVFDIHSVLVFDRVLYDATFGQTYPGIEGLIAASVLEATPAGNMIFRDYDACFVGSGYGQWPFYQQRAPGSCTPAAPAGAAVGLPDLREAPGHGVARFGSSRDILSRLYREEGPSQGTILKVKAPIVVVEEGDFSLEGRLARQLSTGETVAYLAEAQKLAEGKTDLTLGFESPKIDELGSDGRYVLTLVLHRAEPLMRLDSVQLLIDPRERPEYGSGAGY